MVHAKHGVGRIALVLFAAALLLCAGIVGGSGVALAEDPEWTNETAPSTITFDVNVTYSDGSDEDQEVSDSYEVTVIQVRAWELSDDGDQEMYRRPDASTDFSATIYNLGNYQDEFLLSYETRVDGEWGVPGVGEHPALPEGWSVEIRVDGTVDSDVTIPAGNNQAVTVRLIAGEDVQDEELLEVRLVVTTPQTQPEIEGLANLPELEARTEQSAIMVVKIVRNLLTFLLTPGEASSEFSDTSDRQREEFQAYPRDTVPFTGTIHNPSWAEVDINDDISITATFAVPPGVTLDEDTLGVGEDHQNPPYGCSASYDSNTRTITITCSNVFPSNGNLPIAFDITVDAYEEPTNEESDTTYLFTGNLNYVDKAGAEWNIPAAPVVGGLVPGDVGYPSPDPVPEIEVLELLLVKVYEASDGAYPSANPVPISRITKPGNGETFEVWVRNEGNVVDGYSLGVVTQVMDGAEVKFPWSIECNDNVATTGDLDPGEQKLCTVSVEFGPGTEDEDNADVVEIQAESLVDVGVLSNLVEITIDVHAPDITALLTVWMDAEHTDDADQLVPGDTVYIKAEVTNEGREDATDLNVTHTIPAPIEYQGDVSCKIGDAVQACTDDNGVITIGPITLPVGDTLTITYSGKVK